MSLEGKWYNELGSTLEIKADDDGRLSGTYETAVSSAGCAHGVFDLLGTTDVDAGGDTFGFSVTWKNKQSSCNSTTAWSGHYLQGQEILKAFWLLSVKTDPGDEWGSTLVGEDVFTRQALSAERQAEIAARKRHPHP